MLNVFHLAYFRVDLFSWFSEIQIRGAGQGPARGKRRKDWLFIYSYTRRWSVPPQHRNHNRLIESSSYWLRHRLGLRTSDLRTAWIFRPQGRVFYPRELHQLFPHHDISLDDDRCPGTAQVDGLGRSWPCHLFYFVHSHRRTRHDAPTILLPRIRNSRKPSSLRRNCYLRHLLAFYSRANSHRDLSQ